MSTIIKLDRKEIETKIEHGDRADGNYVLAVAPDGSNCRVHWNQTNQQWDPWPDGWLIISIPSLFPEGSGEEYELAQDCLRSNGLDADAVLDEIDASREYDGLVAYADAKFPEWMKDGRDNGIVFLADAFLAACNGDGTELNNPQPWGYSYDEEGEPYDIIQPPAEFEWA